MSERPTPEEILAAHTIECIGPGEVTCLCREPSGWMSWTSHRRHQLAALAAHGYRIVHPDDVPEQATAEAAWGPAWAEGWNACRAHIFGEGS